MNAPDKIFISIERTYGASNGQVIGMTVQHSEKQSESDIEYIRKDALMEWAKEQKAVDESLWAEMHWWDIVIAKIKSM